MEPRAERVGYVRDGRGPLLTRKLHHPRHGFGRLPFPAIDSYLQLAYALGCEPESPQIELNTLANDEEAADAVWKQSHLPPGDQVVVLNSGGAYGAAKLWPSEYFAELARRIVDEQGLAVLVTCGPDERDIARRIVALADHPRVVSLAEETNSIGLTKACVRRSRAMVTTDSGPRFFAVAFGVPVVTLFGPTHMGWTRTHYAREICLQHAVPCGPCGRRVCPLGHHDCMRSLSVERVYAAVRRQLGASQTFKQLERKCPPRTSYFRHGVCRFNGAKTSVPALPHVDRVDHFDALRGVADNFLRQLLVIEAGDEAANQ